MSAAPEQIPTDLTLEVGTELTPEQFLAVARAFFGYVQELTAALDPQARSDSWIVRVREGSTLLGIDPKPTLAREVVRGVYKRAEVGLRHLANRDIERAALPEGAFKHLKVLSEMTGAKPKGGAPIPMRLWVERKPISLEPVIANTIREEGYSDYSDHGSIEGKLETIQDDRGSLQFRIRDALLRQKIQCYFPEALLQDVFDKFRKRVEVTGVIHYRRNGTPISIAAERITALPDDSDLPSAADVRGILAN